MGVSLIVLTTVSTLSVFRFSILGVAHRAVTGLLGLVGVYLYDSKLTSDRELSDLVVNNDFPYVPFAPDSLKAVNYGLESLPSNEIIIGEHNQNNFINANDKGSKVWAKSGLNYMIANEGKDTFYFSACDTKLVGNKVKSVIQGFNATEDKIELFCSKTKFSHDNISIKHSEGFTYIEAKGASDISVIGLKGEIDIYPQDIILTTLGEVKEELGVE